MRRNAWSRRIVVVAVPPVDELDLVGPMQVFNSVNRLAGRTVYTIEVVTTAIWSARTAASSTSPRLRELEHRLMRRAFVRLLGDHAAPLS